jgi:hypothetical protein
MSEHDVGLEERYLILLTGNDLCWPPRRSKEHFSATHFTRSCETHIKSDCVSIS